MKIEARNLGWRRIVRDVSCEIRPGETFGLVGPNGSGKSTLLRLLAGLVPRAAGEVRLDGEPMATLSRRQVAQRIALVEQFADTGEALCVRDAVELGRTPWLSPLSPFGPEDHRIVDEALEAVDMAGMAARPWSTLSGGERQRIHIARALAQKPRLLILDEPTNHLDVHHQLSLLGLVAALPVTVIMALHDLNQAMICDRVGVMSEGRMVACGPPAEVLTPDCLARIFRVRATPMIDPEDGSIQFRFLSIRT
ncbi:ABC transporter ATP-binding protein [Rhodobacter sp. NTK016B]|uniref:ABC transporter ATP-binding protein n=1 Tax=Rhodobacter sp. NTK016B TaxID=2759676 RepID=UPI001A8FF2DD|nr:ABC transporter ATP-binding protein [Rhodobacter sp. NTK016B]